ncbi:unnamed protein product [Menidia menidia]|uniref:(Atlantic silverside) hypothetical protein n=1 Tax=Menidia menidia TaxID=238744 RepID=A0A8S4AZD4_9TELE|nr:unnamed protein product [Menidia menidia]
MPVFYSPVPENLQMGLAYMGGSVFTNNRTADSDYSREQEDDMEEFVQSSGDAGIVVFSLGSMIKNLTTDKADMIATALAQIPQKNDLLGHPKTKAFITHGGTNGIYEAIYHGVPMVGIPMFADQPDNMVHVKAKGAGLIVDLNFMTAEDLRDALKTVINDKSYKENTMRLSRIHHDRPMNPRDEAVFWIEFTMRNKGAKHLRVQAHQLTWYEYHSLDVLAFLLSIVLLVIFILVKAFSFCFRRATVGPPDNRPGTMKPCLSVWVLLACSLTCANGGNILVWYTEASHWINMKPVLETLVDRGHQVTVLVPSSSMFMNSSEASRFHYQPFNVSVSMKDLEELLEDFLYFSMYEMDHMSYLQIYNKFLEFIQTNAEYSFSMLDGVVKSEPLMKKLKEGNFDLLLADPIYAGSDLTADILDIPLVVSLRFSLANNWERLCGQLPAPPSFVPGAMSKLTDKMNFRERLWNFLFYALQDAVIEYTAWKELNKYYSEFKGTPTSACEMMGKAEIWLIRTYWDFEFPRPFLPNFKFVGGIHCRPAKPLPKPFDEADERDGDR